MFFLKNFVKAINIRAVTLTNKVITVAIEFLKPILTTTGNVPISKDIYALLIKVISYLIAVTK